MGKPSLLIIGFVWPEPKGSAAGSRMMQLIEFFQATGFQITFCSANHKNDKSENLEALQIETRSIELNHSSFDDFVRELAPDIVLYDRFMIEEQFGWRISENCPDAVKILDSEDLHFLRKARGQAILDNSECNDDYLIGVNSFREISSIYRCDLTLVISEMEYELLVEKFKIDPSLLIYLPFMLEPINESRVQHLPSYQARHHFVTIGNFLHPPNYDAAVYLKNEIWPQIRKKLPKAEMHVYGAYPQPKVEQLNDLRQCFYIKGFVDNAEDVMKNAKVCLAPLRYGAGLKGKLILAMQQGTPCVMSSVAAEGIFGTFKINGFIEDDSEKLADRAVDLYTDKARWTDCQLNGYEVINQRFQKSHFYTSLSHSIVTIQKNLKHHRQNNFIGLMLQHHSLHSTKFMSKWIEEKNSKKS